jgi:hypothetical protein
MATFTIGEALAFKLENELKKNLTNELKRTGSIATGSLLKSINFTTKKNKDGFVITLNSNDYLIFIEKGRKPGKYAPIKALQKWVRAKKLAQQPKEVNSIAWAVNNKIKREGIAPKNVVTNAFNKSLPMFDKLIKTTLDEDLQKYLTQEFNKI